jgi:hypothetical protein
MNRFDIKSLLSVKKELSYQFSFFSPLGERGYETVRKSPLPLGEGTKGISRTASRKRGKITPFLHPLPSPPPINGGGG